MCLIIAAVAPAAVVSAQRRSSGRARVVVVRGGDNATREQARGIVAAELERRGVAVRAIDRALEDTIDAGAIVRDAGQLYDHLRFAEARQALDRLDTHAARTGGYGVSRAELVEASTLAALIAIAQGDDASADAAIGRALALDAAYAPDPMRYPPPFVARVERARAASAARGAATLVVSGLSEGARLVVDGTDAGPQRRFELGRGAHFVWADASGYRRRGQRVELTGGDVTIRMTLEPDPAEVLLDAGTPGARVSPEIERSARALGATVVLADVEASGASVRVAVVDAQTGRRGRASGRDLQAALRAALDGAIDVRQSSVARQSASAGASASTSGPIWPWIAAGAGAVVAVAVTVGVIVATQPDEEQPVFVFQWTRPGE